MSSRFNIEALDKVPHKQKAQAYEEIFGCGDVAQNRNRVHILRKKGGYSKLSAQQITTICKVCGISLNEFFIND